MANESAPATRGGRRRRTRIALVVVLLTLLGTAAYLAVVPAVAWTRVERVDAEPGGPRPDDQPGTTYLLVGLDGRGDLSPAERRRLATGRGDGGNRADTIMILHVGSGPALLLSVPRASLVDVPGHGLSMINAAYEYGGAPLLVQSLEAATGIRVDHYVEVGLGGVADSVDAVGGVIICPDRAMDDARAGLHVDAGCGTADGPTALAYARSREAQRLDDLDRAAHQREVVSALARAALSARTLLDPRRYWGVSSGLVASVRVGEDVGAIDMARLGWALRQVSGAGGHACGVPITDADVLAAHWDPERAAEMFALVREDRTAELDETLCQPTGLPAATGGGAAPASSQPPR